VRKQSGVPILLGIKRESPRFSAFGSAQGNRRSEFRSRHRLPRRWRWPFDDEPAAPRPAAIGAFSSQKRHSELRFSPTFYSIRRQLAGDVAVGRRVLALGRSCDQAFDRTRSRECQRLGLLTRHLTRCLPTLGEVMNVLRPKGERYGCTRSCLDRHKGPDLPGRQRAQGRLWCRVGVPFGVLPLGAKEPVGRNFLQGPRSSSRRSLLSAFCCRRLLGDH
jgi:hypothetical protein